MKRIGRKDIKKLVLGSTFFGTGGGGRPSDARKIFRKAFKNDRTVFLRDMREFDKDALFVTAFGVGSSAASSVVEKAITKAFSRFTDYLPQKVQGIVPVEIGPVSLATAFYLASILDLPVIDADMVGGRSSPEVYLETITLFGIRRTPLVLANERGDVRILTAPMSFVREEKRLRDFASVAGGRAYVVGYPATKRLLSKAVEKKTITRTLTAGELLRDGRCQHLLRLMRGRVLYSGTVQRIEARNTKGFAMRTIVLSDGNSIARIYLKNEYLVLRIEDKTVLTCPDLIVLVDERGVPVYGTEVKGGMHVWVAGIPALPLWRSSRGVSLFNPARLGFRFRQKLLEGARLDY
jgi:hypothetical protein